MRKEFLLPDIAINRHQGVELLTGEVFHTTPVQVLVARHTANRTLDTYRTAMRSLDNPLQDAHIITKARPHVIALGITTEPIHAEYTRRIGQLTPEVQPMVEVVSHMIA